MNSVILLIVNSYPSVPTISRIRRNSHLYTQDFPSIHENSLRVQGVHGCRLRRRCRRRHHSTSSLHRTTTVVRMGKLRVPRRARFFLYILFHHRGRIPGFALPRIRDFLRAHALSRREGGVYVSGYDVYMCMCMGDVYRMPFPF